MQETDHSKYLPLSEATTYILLCLVEPTHGYGVMQKVETRTTGQVKIGPGTLYGAFSTMESEKLIEMVSEADRRKTYRLTAKGLSLLRAQLDRLDLLLSNGRSILEELI